MCSIISPFPLSPPCPHTLSSSLPEPSSHTHFTQLINDDENSYNIFRTFLIRRNIEDRCNTVDLIYSLILLVPSREIIMTSVFCFILSTFLITRDSHTPIFLSPCPYHSLVVREVVANCTRAAALAGIKVCNK